MGANATFNSFRKANYLIGPRQATAGKRNDSSGTAYCSSAISSIDIETVCFVGTHSTFMNSAATLMGM